MNKNGIDKAYVSPYDRFLFEFDASHEPSESQLKEIKKHERIALLRDHADSNGQEKSIWKDF